MSYQNLIRVLTGDFDTTTTKYAIEKYVEEVFEAEKYEDFHETLTAILGMTNISDETRTMFICESDWQVMWRLVVDTALACQPLRYFNCNRREIS
jgi:hypothetical protein